MQRILAIDTVSDQCSVALQVDDETFSKTITEPRAHTRLLLPSIRELLSTAQITLGELDALAVDVGPGSFTGVRIGIGVTQGLAYGLGLPILTSDSLRVLAYIAATQQALPDKPILAMMDARMGQVYWAVFDHQINAAGTQLTIRGDVRLSDAADVIFAEPCVVVGNGYAAYPQLQQNIVLVGAAIPAQPTALAVLRAAAIEVSALELAPSYVRNQVIQNQPKKST